jgi:hypothetical protein
MTDSITPPPEVQQWRMGAWQARIETMGADVPTILLEIAQWGADTELEACLASIHTMYGKDKADWLRAMRRPKPPSLKEQALEILQRLSKYQEDSDWDTIRRALEALPE